MQSSYELNQPVQAPPVHLSDYLAVLKRRKWLMIGFFILLVGTVSYLSFTTQPIYQASAKIIIEPPSTPTSSPGFQRFGRASDKEDFLETQYHMLRSRELAKRVLARIALENGQRQPSQEKNSSSTADGKTSWFPRESQARELSDAKGAEGSPLSPYIVNNYMSNLLISSIRGSQLVKISYSDPSPQQSARIANAHARAFIELKSEKNHAEAQRRLQWLETELKKQKSMVEASLASLHSYRQQNNIVSLNERQTSVSQKISELNSSLIKANAEVEANRAALKELQRLNAEDQSVISLPEISEDEIIKTLRNEKVLLDINKSELAATFGPEHPKMIELDSRIRQVDNALDKEIDRLRLLIKNNYKKAITKATGLRRQIEDAQHEAMELQEKQSEYEVLERETESNQKLYDVLLNQAKEIGLWSVFDSNNVRIMEEAGIPGRAEKPKILLNILLACALGLFMGAGLAFFVDYMDNTVKTTEDVHRHLNMPVIGGIPYEKALEQNHFPALPEPGCIPNSRKKHHALPGYGYNEAAIRLPATKFRFDNTGMSGQVLLMESASMGEGKTTVLGNIAVNLGKSGFRVLVMDCDFQRPAAHHLFNTKNDNGLWEAMTKILSQDISNGTLDICGISDLFALISLKKSSGRLTVTNQSGDMTKTVFFQDGRLLHIESPNTPVENRLGNMLARGGVLSEPQLANALEWNNRTGQPLGYILINAGYIKQDQLQGPLNLQMREHIQTLFSWKQGTFSFEPGEVTTYANERIYFAEDYTPIIKQLAGMAGSPLLENEILTRITLTKRTNVHILPAGATTMMDEPGAVNYMLLIDFLELLKRRFDIILIDTPPLLHSVSTAPLHTLADGVVFVVKSGKLSLKILNEAKTRLADYDAKIMGVVLNQVKNMQSGDCY